MKNHLAILFYFIFLGAYAQENIQMHIPLLGEDAPKFKAETTTGEITFPDDYFAKWKILFSHPADFTPVCSSEIIELAYLQDELKKLNTQIVVLSTDGINSHLEWIKSLESINYEDKDKVTINFPLVSDVGLEISKKYGMIHPNTNKTKDVRGVFIIDPDNKIAAEFFYPVNVGRNIDEILRTLIALQEVDNQKIMTPANWKLGNDVLIASPKTPQESDAIKAKNDSKLYNYTWYMWFRKQ